MTPIRHQGAESSPMRLMQQRTIRGILPTRQQETNQCNYEKFRTRKLEQSQYQTGQNLPTLPIGSNVLYYSAVRNQWSPGVIVERVHDRSYTVISQKGRMLSRNRVDLKPYHREVTISFEPPKSPSSPFDMPGRQTNIQTEPTKIPHHIHHPKPRPKWFTPEWLTPWVTTINHHHKQTDIATDMIRNHLHTHLSTHQKVTHHQLYHANISARHQILSTKRDPLPRTRIYHLRPVHDKTNLKLNVNQRQRKI